MLFWLKTGFMMPYFEIAGETCIGKTSFFPTMFFFLFPFFFLYFSPSIFHFWLFWSPNVWRLLPHQAILCHIKWVPTVNSVLILSAQR